LSPIAYRLSLIVHRPIANLISHLSSLISHFPNMTYQFKTNINCGGCIATVTPKLEAVEGIQAWEVDTDNPDKILTVETESLAPQAIMAAVEEAGFKIEEKKKGLFRKLFE